MAEPFFRVNGVDYPLPEDLTLGEICDAEQFFGAEFTPGKERSVRMTAAMLWIAIKRADPSVTVDDVRALPPEVFKSAQEAADERLDPPSDANENGNSGSSGGGSEATTGITADRKAIGSRGSGIGSLASVRTTSAA